MGRDLSSTIFTRMREVCCCSQAVAAAVPVAVLMLAGGIVAASTPFGVDTNSLTLICIAKTSAVDRGDGSRLFDDL